MVVNQFISSDYLKAQRSAASEKNCTLFSSQLVPYAVFLGQKYRQKEFSLQDVFLRPDFQKLGRRPEFNLSCRKMQPQQKLSSTPNLKALAHLRYQLCQCSRNIFTTATFSQMYTSNLSSRPNFGRQKHSANKISLSSLFEVRSQKKSKKGAPSSEMFKDFYDRIFYFLVTVT